MSNTTTELASSVREYLEAVEATKSPATYTQYRSVLEEILLPWCASERVTEPSQINDGVMVRFTDHLRKSRKRKGKDLSSDTLRTYLRTVRVYLNWASVPRGKFKAPKRQRRVRDVLSRSEIDALENAALDERDRLIIRVLADTGIRVGELLNLKPSDLRQDAYTKGTVLLVDGKTGERQVAIGGPLFKRLKSFADGNKQPYIFNGKRRNSSGEIERLTNSGCEQLVRYLAKTARIEKRTYPHLFRHSYVTHMAHKGISPVIVQQQMGHSSLTLIAETYSHIQTSQVGDMLEKALR